MVEDRKTKTQKSGIQMKQLLLIAFFLAPGSVLATSNLALADANTLDNYLPELKDEGSLSNLCKKYVDISECKRGVGEWKSRELESVKMNSLICFDKCPLDVFGFYRNSVTGRDMPAVRTKDFDGSAPSRGHEITFYPVAVKIFRYEGCSGCELTYTYPTGVKANFNGTVFSLPRLTRGGYYIPARLRNMLAKEPSGKLILESRTTKVFKGSGGKREEEVRISSKAVSEISRMLRTLSFAK